MIVSLVVAVAENGVIGADNGLPWRLKGDMKHFRAVTMGKPVIMGRKTFQSIGKPLSGRTNIVLSRTGGDVPEGVVLVHSLAQALATAQETGAEEACVIGGAEIYMQTLPRADRLHLTRVHMQARGDTYFPDIDPTAWREEMRERHEAGAEDTAAFTIYQFDRVAAGPAATTNPTKRHQGDICQ